MSSVDDELVSHRHVAGRSTTTQQRARHRRFPGVAVTLAMMWLALMAFLVVFVQWLPLADYTAPIGPPQAPPSLDSLNTVLGLDPVGRSVLSRLAWGARASLGVSLFAVTIGLVVGGTLGLIAGYRRGWTDEISGIGTDTVLAFPPLVLLVAITAILTTSFTSLVIALSLLSIPAFMRMSRANTISLTNREFVVAARALGATTSRILARELAPNVVLPLISYASLIVAVIIVAEGSLSYLGLGIPPPTPSWGGMIATGQPYLDSNPRLSLVPAALMFLTVMSFNVLGDWARRRSDVRGAAL